MVPEPEVQPSFLVKSLINLPKLEVLPTFPVESLTTVPELEVITTFSVQSLTTVPELGGIAHLEGFERLGLGREKLPHLPRRLPHTMVCSQKDSGFCQQDLGFSRKVSGVHEKDPAHRPV